MAPSNSVQSLTLADCWCKIVVSLGQTMLLGPRCGSATVVARPVWNMSRLNRTTVVPSFLISFSDFIVGRLLTFNSFIRRAEFLGLLSSWGIGPCLVIAKT